jgi:hypothetical protein
MKVLFSGLFVGALAAATCAGCMSVVLCAQDSQTPAPSLGDLARQNRVQHASTDQKPSTAQNLVDEMQAEQEASSNAPVGFTNFDAGAYRLFVPYPSSLEGRDNGGAVLLGSRVGVTNTEVLAGNPVPIPPNTNEALLGILVRQLASLHGQNAYCSPIQQGTRKAFRCSWQASPYLLGHEVWGSMEFIVASSSLIPVMCVSPDDPHQVCVIYDNRGNNTCTDRNRQLYGWDTRKAQAAADARYKDERTTMQMCDQIIYPSIQLKEDIVVHPVTIAENKTPKTATPAPALDKTVVAVGSPTTPLADLARQARQAPHAKPQATLDNSEANSSAPAGFQSFTVAYCINPQQCSQATVVIPEKVEVVSKINAQYIFKTALNDDPVFLYAGPADVNAPYRSMTSPDYIRMRDLANSNGWSREKAGDVSTQEVTIQGRPALITRFRYEREAKKFWIGERVLIENVGHQFLLGCTAPDGSFADAEALCTTLVNSWRPE